jgi:hypothetical protein
MKTIKFSEVYEKMPFYADNPPTQATLLEVFKVNSEDLHKRFIEYDTIYFDKKINNLAYYKLPKGEVLVLILKSQMFNDNNFDLWTTIRRFTPSKYEYYKKSRGETFNIEIVKK